MDYVRPYANTTDLKNFTPNIDYDLAEQRQKERQFKFNKGLEVEEDEKENDNEILLETNLEGETKATNNKKKESRSKIDDEKESQEFKLTYSREHAIGYL